MIDTRIVLHEIRAMKKNVTITLDEETARWVRVEAARRDTSVSSYVGELLAERRRRVEGYQAARATFLIREPRPLRDPGTPLPGRSERHERSDRDGGTRG
jgi:hypothetical protein